MIEIISVLPQIERQQRHVPAHQRRTGVAGGEDLKCPGAPHQPQPAAAEVRTGGIGELAHEALVRAEALAQPLADEPGGRATAAWMHRVPVEVVVVHLRGVAIQHVLRWVALGHADQLDEIERLELRATHHGEHPVEAHALMAQEVKHHGVARDRRL